MQENKAVRCRCHTYKIEYHIVWAVKHMHNVLSKEVEECIQELFARLASIGGYQIHSVSCGDGTYVSCYVIAPPDMSVSQIVKNLKSKSSRTIWANFPQIETLLPNRNLWNHSYYVETIGYTDDNQLDAYLALQQNAY
jgi:putative transposase